MKKKFTYKDLKKIYFSQVNELIEIINILMNDLSRIIKRSNEMAIKYRENSESKFLNEQGTWFRLANRITITTIETIFYKMKQITLLLFDYTGKTLSPKDREKLSEMKSDGSPCYLKTHENMKFAIKMFADVLGIQFKIKYDKEWSNFLKVIKKRHALTHPKFSTDLNMSVHDHNNSVNAFGWFYSILKQFTNEIERNKKIKMKLEIS